MRKFSRQYRIRFSHCDLAGIAFYPELVKLTNWVLEDWYSEMEESYLDLLNHRNIVTPVVKLEYEFIKPIRLEDVVVMNLEIVNIGHSSVSVRINADCNNSTHFRCSQTIVHVDTKTQKAIEIPEALRAKMEAYKNE